MRRLLAIGLCVAGTVTIAWSMGWFAERMMPGSYPARLAYKPVEEMPPPVDLAEVQRDWPNSLADPADRSRLVAYQRDRASEAPLAAATPGAAATAEPPPDLGTLLAGADANTGRQKAQVCKSCHTFEQGGPDRIGPNLWGVVGRDIASRPGFAYSPAIARHPGNWTYDELFAYLASPARAIPGNRMGFAGLRRPEDRAAVIRYLATLGTNAPPLPQPNTGGGKTAAR